MKCNSIWSYIQSAYSDTGRPDQNNWSELLHFLTRFTLTKTHEAFVTSSELSEFSDPLIEHGESQFLFIFLHLHAVVNYDLAKVSPLGYILGQVIELSDLFFLVVDEVFDLFEEIEKVRGITSKLIQITDDFSDVKFGFLL